MWRQKSTQLICAWFKCDLISHLLYFTWSSILLCCKSRLGRVGAAECQRRVSFVFIVLTGAQWYDCLAIWNHTPTQSFRGSEVGEMCVPLVQWTMHFEKARNRRVIHPANHQKHSASLSCTYTRFAHPEKCSHLPDTNYAPPPCCFLISYALF